MPLLRTRCRDHSRHVLEHNVSVQRRQQGKVGPGSARGLNYLPETDVSGIRDQGASSHIRLKQGFVG
ncbi:hypothetical protein XAP7430_1570003 [Xanthomonas phaseoli pv. phaseoli]|uniref:Transposase n=1 Tax=Xanthomonas campestris pv. phaseoli TaxID=317013 RepID=A0AB38DWM0_XANCH|nr:hypothetical protein XAP6984_1480003 [Xanthomonas phaseoli pv. phaseoli]SON84125.1 hypothetical protein XAP7430_1570003 [Xanthomonas phaseoli pv. phaseoli]